MEFVSVLFQEQSCGVPLIRTLLEGDVLQAERTYRLRLTFHFIEVFSYMMGFTTLYILAPFRRISNKFLCSSKMVPHSKV